MSSHDDDWDTGSITGTLRTQQHIRLMEREKLRAYDQQKAYDQQNAYDQMNDKSYRQGQGYTGAGISGGSISSHDPRVTLIEALNKSNTAHAAETKVLRKQSRKDQDTARILTAQNKRIISRSIRLSTRIKQLEAQLRDAVRT